MGAPDFSKLKGKAVDFATRLAFETGLEYNRPKIIAGFREWLTDWTPATVVDMVAKNEFPKLDPSIFAEAEGYHQYLKKISVTRLYEALQEARPDLAEAIETCNMQGAQYMANLRAYLLERIVHPEVAVNEAIPSLEGAQTTEMVTLKCTICQKVSVMPKAEAAKLTECPFCGAKT